MQINNLIHLMKDEKIKEVLFIQSSMLEIYTKAIDSRNFTLISKVLEFIKEIKRFSIKHLTEEEENDFNDFYVSEYIEALEEKNNLPPFINDEIVITKRKLKELL